MEAATVEPIPIKRRVRFSKNGHTYTDQKTADDMERIAASYRGKFYESESLCLLVEVFKPIPKAKAKAESIPFTTKPDVDNVLKAVMDGLKGVAFADDKQVTASFVIKHERTAEIEREYIRFYIGTYKEMGAIIEQLRKTGNSQGTRKRNQEADRHQKS